MDCQPFVFVSIIREFNEKPARPAVGGWLVGRFVSQVSDFLHIPFRVYEFRSFVLGKKFVV